MSFKWHYFSLTLEKRGNYFEGFTPDSRYGSFHQSLGLQYLICLDDRYQGISGQGSGVIVDCDVFPHWGRHGFSDSIIQAANMPSKGKGELYCNNRIGLRCVFELYLQLMKQKDYSEKEDGLARGDRITRRSLRMTWRCAMRTTWSLRKTQYVLQVPMLAFRNGVLRTWHWHFLLPRMSVPCGSSRRGLHFVQARDYRARPRKRARQA